MSELTVRAGDAIVLDPSDKRVVVFDWDASNLAVGVTISASVWTITAVKQSGVTALTKDNESITGSSRTTQVRLLATTATDGDEYWVANKITTNESPAQDKERSIKVVVQNQ